MLTFLFWNLDRKPLAVSASRIASAHRVDFVLLAECSQSDSEVLSELNALAPQPYALPPSLGDRLKVFTRLPVRDVTDVFNSSRMTIRSVRLGAIELLLAVVHFQNLGFWDRDDQTLEATTLATDIARSEDSAGHHRTILVGDLNMNPFDTALIGAQALHGVMTRSLAAREERTVAGVPYRFFYNPMWGHFGDRTPGPPGTFYFRSSKPGNYFWHMYDQVLLRPDLMHTLDDLKILQSDGAQSLVSDRGLPREFACSDHLPLLFSLNI